MRGLVVVCLTVSAGLVGAAIAVKWLPWWSILIVLGGMAFVRAMKQKPRHYVHPSEMVYCMNCVFWRRGAGDHGTCTKTKQMAHKHGSCREGENRVLGPPSPIKNGARKNYVDG